MTGDADGRPLVQAFLNEATPWGHLVVARIPTDVARSNELLASLPEAERERGSTWAPRRALTYAGGRTALRIALSACGVDASAAIGVDDRGAPSLPATARGSISHKDGVAAAIASTLLTHTIGIDLEEIGAESRGVARHVLTVAEQEHVEALRADLRVRAVLTRFSIKEAFYKAIDPEARRYIGFQEAEVEEHDGVWRFTPRSATLSAELAGRVPDIGVVELEGLVVSTCRIKTRA